MADDTAALVVALSAQLSKFEKDMKDAVNISNQKTKEIEDTFIKMNTAITGQMSALAATATRAFGPLGSIIAGLNPITLAVAAAVGLLITVFNSVSESVDKFIEKSKALEDTSRLTGLTVSQLKALGQAGRAAGVEFEQVEKGVVRFAAAFDQLRTTGTGPLEKALERFPGLLKQVAQASDLGEAITLVANAVDGLNDKESKIGVTTDIVSKRNAEFVKVLEAVAKQKLLDPDKAITPAAKATDELTKTITDLSRELAALTKENEEFAAKGIAVNVLKFQVEYQKALLRTKQALVDVNVQQRANREFESQPGAVTEGVAPAPGIAVTRPAAEEAAAFLPVIEKAGEETDKLNTKTKDWTKALQAGLLVDIQKMNQFLGLLGDGATLIEQMIQKQSQLQAEVDAGRITDEQRNRITANFALNLAQQTESLRERLGIATSQERIESRIAQLKADQVKYSQSDADIARATAFIRQDEANRLSTLKDRLGLLNQEQSTQAKINAMLTEADKSQLSRNEKLRAQKNLEDDAAKAKEADRERLGIATEQEIIQERLNQLYKDANYYKYTEKQIEEAKLVILREGKEVAEQQAARRSSLPDLLRAGQQAVDPLKQFDQFATSMFSNFETQLGNVANGTVKLADAFHSMANSIIADLVKIALRMSITGPLQKALSGLFGVSTLGPNSSVADLTGVQNVAGWSTDRFLGQRQGGGPVYSNSPYLVGEHGPELFVPNSSGQIVPGNVMRAGGSGGYNVTVNNYTSPDTDVRQSSQQGPNGESLIIDVVKRNMARGAFDDTNRGRFGLRAQKVR